MCHTETVKLLLQKGASVTKKNRRGESPVDVVSSKWSQGLGDFYKGIGKAINVKIDLRKLQQLRPQIAKLLKENNHEVLFSCNLRCSRYPRRC